MFCDVLVFIKCKFPVTKFLLWSVLWVINLGPRPTYNVDLIKYKKYCQWSITKNCFKAIWNRNFWLSISVSFRDGTFCVCGVVCLVRNTRLTLSHHTLLFPAFLSPCILILMPRKLQFICNKLGYCWLIVSSSLFFNSSYHLIRYYCVNYTNS